MDAAPSAGFDRRTVLKGGLAAAGALTLASLPPFTAEASAPHAAARGPRAIALPDGFAPEDIARGRGATFYVGSLANGAVFRGSFESGRGQILVPSADGPATGLYVECAHRSHGRLWVAGGPSGQARVYDARTGALLATYRLADPAAGSFISDVVVTPHAAYYTDAFRPQLYVIPLRHRGMLPAPDRVRTVRVRGDATYQSGPNVFNLNGIAAVEGRLVTAQTVTGELFTLNPHNGRTRRIPLVDAAGQAATVPGADGFVARGRTLVIAQNFPQSIAIVRLSRDVSRARLIRTLTDARLDIPSAVEVYGDHAFALNARFTTPRTPETPYSVIRV
jgi:outer membrane protein assembly factor BamB